LTIVKGINSVNPNGTVNVADGTYYEHLSIGKNVNLVGQSQENTIIDGNNTGRPITIHSGANVNITLFTIQNGYANNGGGISNAWSTLTVSNSTISGNNATTYGGGIINDYGTLTVSGSTISGNNASVSGGGIWNSDGTVSVSGSTISGNTATYGGGIYNDYGTLTVSGSTISGNNASVSGGGIRNVYSTLTVSGSTISGNTAQDGGGIFNYGATLMVYDSVISGNTAQNGGGIYKYDGTGTVSGSTISGNTAQDGGGIYNTGSGTVTVNFNCIVDNSPTAIENYGGYFNAKYNWWGSNNPDFTTLVGGVVDYSPWLYMTLQSNPTTIVQGETSTLTASFNNAFDGTTVTPLDPISGHIPDKTLVTFSTDLGSVGSKTINKETTNGVATATLTADETPGIAHVNAVTDTQTVNTNVNSKLSTNTTTENKNNYAGQNVILTANVKDYEENNVNEGQVRFTVNDIVGIANVVDGQAVLNWLIPSNWAVGNKMILAEFLGTDNYSTSDGTATLTVVLKPAAWANVKGGLFNVNKNVYLYKNIQNGTIYYTRNGSTPTNASTKYTGYLTISSTTTLKFIAIDLDGNKSPVYTERYVIDKTAPKVTYTYPRHLSTGQSRTATLYLKFSENLKASTYWSKIFVKDLKTGKKVSISKWIKGNILYIKTRYKRPALRWFQVYVPYKSVKDFAGNNLLRTFSYKFKTRS
jgi:hypothetical protein